MNTIETKEIVCPNCGRKYTVPTVSYDGLYLHGMPILPMADLLATTKLCDCGLLVGAREWNGVHTKDILPTAEYQQALHQSYDSEEEFKLALWGVLYHFPFMDMYYAHYYDEMGNFEKRQEYLLRAIDNIRTGVDSQSYIMDGCILRALRYTHGLLLTPQRRLIDLYRCAGDFGAAHNQLKALRHDSRMDAYKRYWVLERDLVRRKISEFR